MKSEKNSSIITAYTLLFTVAVGIVAEDLWTQRNPPPARIARKPAAAKPVQLAESPTSAVIAHTDVTLR